MKNWANNFYCFLFSKIKTKWILGLVCIICFPGCSDSNNLVNAIAKQVVRESDPNKGLFNHDPNTGSETDSETGSASTTGKGQNLSEPLNASTDPSYQKILNGVRNSLPGFDNQKAQIIANRVNELVKSNPKNQILRRGSLCDKRLFTDATNALFQDLGRKNILVGNSASLRIGVTSLPTGGRGNLMWIELWEIDTPKGVIRYPLIFAEDGQGGTFFFVLSN
jgi:hypothetical protein